MNSMEKRYKEMQGIHFFGIPMMEKDIISWHEAINNHKIKINEDVCLKCFMDGDKQDILTARQVSNASKDGELEISMRYYASETGRSTTTGVNIQGLKKGCAGRKAIVPHKDNVFVKVDSSSIEPRCLAVLSKEKSLIDTLQNGGDIYEDFGNLIGLSRSEGKIAFLASMYGQGKKGIIGLFNTFGKTLSEEKATNIKYNFIKKYTNITGGYKREGGLWQIVFDSLLENSFILLPSGRYINYKPIYCGVNEQGIKQYKNIEYGKQTNLWFGRAINNYVQGTARDVFFWQVSQMVKALKGIADICWTVHDDAVFECKKEHEEITKKVLAVCSSMSPNWLGFDKIFKGKVTSGFSYDELGG